MSNFVPGTKVQGRQRKVRTKDSPRRKRSARIASGSRTPKQESTVRDFDGFPSYQHQDIGRYDTFAYFLKKNIEPRENIADAVARIFFSLMQSNPDVAIPGQDGKERDHNKRQLKQYMKQVRCAEVHPEINDTSLGRFRHLDLYQEGILPQLVDQLSSAGQYDLVRISGLRLSMEIGTASIDKDIIKKYQPEIMEIQAEMESYGERAEGLAHKARDIEVDVSDIYAGVKSVSDGVKALYQVRAYLESGETDKDILETVNKVITIAETMAAEERETITNFPGNEDVISAVSGIIAPRGIVIANQDEVQLTGLVKVDGSDRLAIYQKQD